MTWPPSTATTKDWLGDGMIMPFPIPTETQTLSSSSSDKDDSSPDTEKTSRETSNQEQKMSAPVV